MWAVLIMWQQFFYGEQMSEDKLATVVDFPQEWLEKALSITGKFEGSGFNNVSGNFDGMGVSAGVLQWCAGQGSLQAKILKPYIAKYGSIDALGIFPSPIMDQLAESSAESGIRLAIRYMNISKGLVKKSYNLRTDWKMAWKTFLTRPEVIELQMIACEGVAQQSIKLCHEWDMLSARSFCWFFDLVTQNGGLKGVTKPSPDRLKVINALLFATNKNAELWKVELDTMNDEQKILLIASYERAKLARSAYQKDVMDRKGTIAMGKGHVHGEKFENIT